eukprot:NODE_513_length_6632_cov_0.519301.p1 type:complete len:521 gc:universal NODE_513_length_6632_cov_0.519301:4966-6528(+)
MKPLLINLPLEILSNISKYLNMSDIYSLMICSSEIYLTINSDEFWKNMYFSKYNAFSSISNYKLEYKKRLMQIHTKSSRFCNYLFEDHIVLDILQIERDFTLIISDDFKVKVVRLQGYKYWKKSINEYLFPLQSYFLQPHRHLIVNQRLWQHRKEPVDFAQAEPIKQCCFIDEQSDGILLRYSRYVELLFKSQTIAKFEAPDDIEYMVHNRFELFIFSRRRLHIYKIDFKKLEDHLCKIHNRAISFELPFEVDQPYFKAYYYPFCLFQTNLRLSIYNLDSKMLEFKITLSEESFCADIFNQNVPVLCVTYKNGIVQLYDISQKLLLNHTQLKNEVICIKLSEYFLFACTNANLIIMDSSTLIPKRIISLRMKDIRLAPNISPFQVFYHLKENDLTIWIFFSNGTTRFIELECFAYKKVAPALPPKSKQIPGLRLKERHARNPGIMQRIEHEQWVLEYDNERDELNRSIQRKFNGSSQLSEEEMINLAMQLSLDHQDQSEARQNLEDAAIIEAVHSSMNNK